MKKLLIVPIFSLMLQGSSFDDFKKQQYSDTTVKDFQKHKKTVNKEFDAYIKAQERAFEEYKKEVGAFWEEPKMPTKKDWVYYSKDKLTRSVVDFDKGIITIETIAKDTSIAARNLKNTLANTVSISVDEAYKNDPLQQKLSKIKKPYNGVSSDVSSQSVIKDVVLGRDATKDDLNRFIQNSFKKKNLKKVNSSKIEEAKVYTLSVSMPKDKTIKLSKQYLNKVETYSDKYKLTKPLIFAIIETESSYNPFAKSHIPAYGLMQIVPRSAGIDAYNHVYKQKKMPSASYLYNEDNNIELGSAYLHILYYRYLKSIKDPTSRLYCAIAAYNTGSGNIAYAFTGSYNMAKAAPKINSMSSDEVYNRLLSHLKFDEAKQYLKKVHTRMNKYAKIY